MGTGRVGPASDDREVDVLMAFGEEPVGELGGHRRLAPADQADLAPLQGSGDPVGRGGGGPERFDLDLVLDGSERGGDRRGLHELRSGQPALEREDGARPRAIRDP